LFLVQMRKNRGEESRELLTVCLHKAMLARAY